MTIYCKNPLCETEAVTVASGEGDDYVPLCATCETAFEMGAARGPDGFTLQPLEDFLHELPAMLEDEEDWPEWARGEAQAT